MKRYKNPNQNPPPDGFNSWWKYKKSKQEQNPLPPPDGFETWKKYKEQNPKISKKEKYIRIGIFQINEVLPFIGPNKKEYLNQIVNMNSQRYELFKEKGCNCVKYGLVGTHFALERQSNHDKYHFNLYGVTENGEEMLMTKDHILPKSMGGKNHLSNYQTMCFKCNIKKGNTIS